jgi:2-haloacid dehalogenase
MEVREISMPVKRSIRKLPPVRALAIDIFGTVANWRGSIVAEGKHLKAALDWGSFADQWMEGYRARVEAVRTGQRLWANLDVLLAEAFEDVRGRFDLKGIDAKKIAHFSGVWHRLRPWPDCVPGLIKLRKRFVLGTLSNGNMSLLVDMARHAHLPFDCILSAELVKHYKPAPEPYRLAVEVLGAAPQDVMYVASHKWDLTAGAKEAGMKTAFIPRLKEMPGINPSELTPDPSYDINAKDFEDLARQLKA